MADVKWIKITVDIFDDEKVLLIESLPDGDAIIVIWFKLLCLAGKQNNHGVFMLNDSIPYTDEMLATIFRRKVTTVKMALETFERFGMIARIDGTVTIPKWGKHQSLDKLERRQGYMRDYMRDYRQKQKELTCKVNSKVNVNSLEGEIDKENNICAPEPHEDKSKAQSVDDQLKHDFEIIYGIYPKKRGRTVAFANYKQWVGKGKDVCGKKYRLTNKQIYLAVKRYVRQQEEAGNDDLQYWKNFDTLMGRQLLDYVQFEATSV